MVSPAIRYPDDLNASSTIAAFISDVVAHLYEETDKQGHKVETIVSVL